MIIMISVGGGISLTPGATGAGGAVEALAIGLVPAGLTPVAVFPPAPAQQLQALSVIFLEAAPVKKKRRKKRYVEKESLYSPYSRYAESYEGISVLCYYTSHSIPAFDLLFWKIDSIWCPCIATILYHLT